MSKRLAGESFEDYKLRLKQERVDDKILLKGKVVWPSAYFKTKRNKAQVSDAVIEEVIEKPEVVIEPEELPIEDSPIVDAEVVEVIA